jgi:hypothetical protein
LFSNHTHSKFTTRILPDDTALCLPIPPHPSSPSHLPLSINRPNSQPSQKTEYEAYTSHVVSLAAYTTATSVLHTATYSVDAEPVSILQAAATATTPVTVPSVATPAPTDVQAFLQSVLQHEVSLLQYDRTATATATYNAAVKPTGVVMAAGAAAVGVLGLAML